MGLGLGLELGSGLGLGSKDQVELGFGTKAGLGWGQTGSGKESALEQTTVPCRLQLQDHRAVGVRA